MKPTSNNLTKKAALTFSSQLLSNAALLISGFMFTPIIVNGLGKELFGVWGMIQQITGYLGLSNFNAMNTLKLKLGIRQHSKDISEKRRMIGSAIRQWIVFTPLMLLVGLGIVHFTPVLFKISPVHETSIRWTILIMVVTVPLGQLLSMPAAVLRSQNIEYKAMGLNAGMVLLAGVLNVIGILAGYGLVVLSLTTLMGLIVVNGVRLLIVRKNLDWFGQERPTNKEFLTFLRLSGMVFLTIFSGMLLTSADVVLIGFLIDPETVAVYLMTGALVRFVSAPVQQLLSSGNAGIARLIGARDWKRVEALRIELHQVAFLFLTILGAVVILLNPAFVSIWVGETYYGGLCLNLAIVLMAFTRQLVFLDRIPLDNVLRLGHTLILQFFCGSIVIVLAYIITPIWGSALVPLCMALGYAFVLIGLQFLIRKFTAISIRGYTRAMSRCTLSSMILLFSAWLSSNFEIFYCKGWIELILKGVWISLIVGVAYFYMGFSAKNRSNMIGRASLLFRPMANIKFLLSRR